MDAAQEVKSRLSIEDIIGEYVVLKRSGNNWKGLSPFSNEKTPSFVVSPEKQIWHDFSSGRGGDMFSFVMEVEGLDFKDCLELLARKAGIDLDQYQSSRGGTKGPSKERLYELLELSSKFYQVQFSKHKIALQYVFKERGFNKETVLEWQLGYAPNNGTALFDFALAKDFTELEIKQAGLSSQRYHGPGDMFRGRLMIPLHDPQGRIIGFTARLLIDDEQAPKYINTPQTILYDKSRHIYGLHLAKDSIRKNHYAVLVEGNLDVIASHQINVRHVVATAGTALTEPHLKALSRLTNDIRLGFDADKAGLAATERAIPLASRVHISLNIIDIPGGKDPDELIKENPSLWINTIQKPCYAIDWLIIRYEKLLDLNSALGKRQYSDILLPIIRGLNDDVEKDHYLNLISQKLKIERASLDQKLLKTSQQATPVQRKKIKYEPHQINKALFEAQKVQDNFLSLMLIRPTLREFLDLIMPEMLQSKPAIDLLLFLKDNLDFHGDNTNLPGLHNLQDYVKIETLLYEELYQGLELNELHYEAARLQARLIEEYVKNKKADLSNLLEKANETDTRLLLEQAKKYDILLKRIKGGGSL